MPAATSSSLAWSRSAIATFIRSSSASFFASALPTPPVAPVTIAVLPAKLAWAAISLLLVGSRQAAAAVEVRRIGSRVRHRRPRARSIGLRPADVVREVRALLHVGGPLGRVETEDRLGQVIRRHEPDVHERDDSEA